MFDTIVHKHSHHTSVTEEVTKVEQRAPTDESMRLVQEMEKKVRDRIIGAMQVNDNSLNCQVTILHDHERYEVRAFCLFTLNGKKFECSAAVPQHIATGRQGFQTLTTKVMEDISGTITAFLMEQVADAAAKSMTYWR